MTQTVSQVVPLKRGKGKKTIQERFEEVHAAHPEIFTEFMRLTNVARRQGFKRYSADGIMHVIRFQRWESMADVAAAEGFKISNDLISRYVRLAIETDPTLRVFFSVRQLRTQ